ncbi:glycoside hydrolase superfamily [Pilobolus umbonatus]|nr:glycoside hydrolase superfamily [Pilobolus umbonatus]
MKLVLLLLNTLFASLCMAYRVYSPSSYLQARDPSSSKVIVGYFPNWLYGRFLPSSINFQKYTHVYYAFAIQNSAGVPIWPDSGLFDEYVQYGFPKLVTAAHAAGTKVIVSNGGWSGSTGFSLMAASSDNRAAWISWNIDIVKKWGTDGVDIDWEYPNSVGAGCNAVNSQDVVNLNTLVKELRDALDKNFPDTHKEITLAVHISPFGGGDPVTDVSGFVPFVDRFHIMTFDVNGAWNSTSGPNAPFHSQPGFGYAYGLVEGVELWKAAGVPYNKIAVGIPFYGRSQTLTVDDPKTQYNPAVSPDAPKGDSLDGPYTNAYCSKDSISASGVWRYANMRSQGILTSPTTAASPWVRHFDEVTQTPWLFNPETKVFISYDDVVSLGVKTKYALDTGLAGLFVWSIEQDNGELLDAIYPVIANNPRPTVAPSKVTSIIPSQTSISSSIDLNSSIASPSVGSCSGVAVWSPSNVYTAGMSVVSDGHLYTAEYWTQGTKPTGNAWSGWKPVKSC